MDTLDLEARTGVVDLERNEIALADRLVEPVAERRLVVAAAEESERIAVDVVGRRRRQPTR